MQSCVCFLVFLISPAFAQVFFFGPCPEYPVVRRFKTERFAGKWYEQQKYFDARQDLIGTKCTTETFRFLENGTVILMEQSFPAESFVGTGKVKVAAGLFQVPTSTEAKFDLKYAENLFPSGPQWILETDYKNFAIKWSCINYHLFSLQLLWVLTRERDARSEILSRAHDELEILGLNPTHLSKTDQRNCPDL